MFTIKIGIVWALVFRILLVDCYKFSSMDPTFFWELSALFMPYAIKYPGCHDVSRFFDAYLKVPSTNTAITEQLKTGGNLNEMTLDWFYVVWYDIFGPN